MPHITLDPATFDKLDSFGFDLLTRAINAVSEDHEAEVLVYAADSPGDTPYDLPWDSVLTIEDGKVVLTGCSGCGGSGYEMIARFRSDEFAKYVDRIDISTDNPTVIDIFKLIGVEEV